MAARKPLIKDLNEHLVCSVCKGYYVDATTIVECLHSFCRSCIVRHLETSRFCPLCEVQVHKAKPLHNIRPDPTLQTLVYKLVPGLYHREMQRRRQYYSRGDAAAPGRITTPEERGVGASAFFSPDDSISLSLHYYDSDKDDDASDTDTTNERRFLKCPAAVSVRQLKRFIRLKYGLSCEHRVDIIYAGECLREEFTLMDVAYTFSWKRTSPMEFSYRIFEQSLLELMDATPDESPTCSDEGDGVDDTPHNSTTDAKNGETDEPPTKKPKLACENSETSAQDKQQSQETSAPSAGEQSLDSDKQTKNACEGESTNVVMTGVSSSREETELDKNVSQTIAVTENFVLEETEIPTSDIKDQGGSLEHMGVTPSQVSAKDDSPTIQGNVKDVPIKQTSPSGSSVHVVEPLDPATIADDYNEEDEDDMPALRISSTEEEDEVTGNEASPKSGKSDSPQKEPIDEKSIKAETDKAKSKQKDEKEYSSSKKKKKSKHHHQRTEDGSKKRKMYRCEHGVTPTIVQYDEDTIKLKVKLSSPTSASTSNPTSIGFNHRHHHHHHHHSKHHPNKHKQPETESEAPVTEHNTTTTDAATKDRLLQIRAFKQKFVTNSSKTPETSVAATDSTNNKSKKNNAVYMPVSTITVSKVNTADKRKIDLQKLNSNERKRPSLEIMLVNAPANDQPKMSHTTANKSTVNRPTPSMTVKQSTNSQESDFNKKPGIQSETSSNTKQTRPPPPPIPLVRIKKPSTGSIRPPAGLTITNVNSKLSISKQTSVKSIDTASSSGSAQKALDATKQESDGEHMKHDNCGALDLSGKSSRSKDGSSPTPSGLDLSPGPSGSTPSPGKTSPSFTPQNLLSMKLSQSCRKLAGMHPNLSSSKSPSPRESPANIVSSSLSSQTGSSSPNNKESSGNILGAVSGSNTSSNPIAPSAAMSNLQTLSDTAVHVQKLMVQSKSGGRGNVKPQMTNIQNAQLQKASLLNSLSVLGINGRPNAASLTGTGRLAVSFNPLQRHHQASAISRSTNSPSQYTLPGSSISSPSSPIRIPIPNLKSSPLGRGTSANPRSNVPNLHELYSCEGSIAAQAKGKTIGSSSFTSRPNTNNTTNKPGPNKGVRYIPNPSALLFRQQPQHRLPQNAAATSRNMMNTVSDITSTSNSGNKLQSLYQQNQDVSNSNSNSNSKSNNKSAVSSSVPAQTTSPVSTIQKMECMTRSFNIEKVAAGLSMRAVETNGNAKRRTDDT